MTENDFFTAVEEIKRSVHDLSLPGFQIGSHIGDWNLDAPELYPVYKVYLIIIVQYYQYIPILYLTNSTIHYINQ